MFEMFEVFEGDITDPHGNSLTAERIESGMVELVLGSL